MQVEKPIPYYLQDDFSMYLENMSSLSDPENPELLTVYLSDLFKQLKKNPLLFTGMVDQLAMAITTKVRVDSKSLASVELNNEPDWLTIKPFVGVHADARDAITEIMTHAEQDLKMAVLILHFYSNYDATPIQAEDETAGSNDDYLNDDFDENY